MELFSLQQYENKRICVALSGGADSVCLLHALLSGVEKYRITVSALTCEHGIRGDASLADLRFVEKLCGDLNVPLTVFRADVPKRAKAHKRGLEEEGRIFRRECFRKILSDGKADLIATAHHRDDLAETVLFRLIRGTSLSGLYPFSDGRIVHPLLSVGRAEIERYVKENALDFVTDESNFDENYARNFLRHKALPMLESVVCGAGEHLAAFAEKTREDDAYLQEAAFREIRRSLGEIHLSKSLPFPIFSRAAVLAFRELGIEKDYTETNVRDVYSLGSLQSGKKITLPRGIEAVSEGEDVVFYRKTAPCQDEIPFHCGAFSFGDYRLSVSEEETEGLKIDFDALPQNCVIRTRREGDGFTPYGNGQKTLKKFLTDRKIPSRVGSNLPLLANGNEIFAVFGVEISEKVKLTKNTKRIAYLRAVREE